MSNNLKNEFETKVALEARASEDDRLSSPSAGRNRDVIRDIFKQLMPAQGTALEIGSGTGEHAMHIAATMPGITWQPSDPDPASRRSISAWREHLTLANVQAPLALDVTAPAWWQHPDLPDRISMLISINMIHIAPFAAVQGLLAGAGELLSSGDRLFLYGPFKRHGETAPSNHEFDASLKSRDEGWGVRDLDLEILPLADQAGLSLTTVIEMPANNLSVIFSKD